MIILFVVMITTLMMSDAFIGSAVRFYTTFLYFRCAYELLKNVIDYR